jgi:hypothetical protein
MAETIWRKPNIWEWTYDEEPGVGGTQYSVETVDGKIKWVYSEDRWGRSGEQSIADFAGFGPLWGEAPREVVEEMAAHFGLKDKAWMKEGYRDYSPVWWAVGMKKEAEAVAMLTAEDAHRRYHGQKTLLMLAAEEGLRDVVKRLIEMGADVNAPDEYGKSAADRLAR